jgi:hypothetical protein
MTVPPEPIRLPTEEDLRSRILLPYLGALGIGPDQIRTEQSFTLRLGHHVVVKNRPEAPESIRGRLDVLVTNSSGDPLFVVELKREGVTITDEDRDQGIAYARLLHPMAPFVLVTNGRSGGLYDTITKLEIGESQLAGRLADWREGSVRGAEDLRLRHEALQYFISYSDEGLRLFLAAQQQARTRGLRGDPHTHEKKYLPNTYVSRAQADAALDGFLQMPATAFVLTGPSGSGKTNVMCAWVERLAPKYPVVFLNGAELHGSLSEILAAEFNWHFSETLTLPQICQRLARFAERTRHPVLILADAIDETGLRDAPRAFSELVGHLQALEGKVRLVAALKSSEWPSFARFGGNPSPLAEHCFHPPKARSRSEGRESARPAYGPVLPVPSFELGYFTASEREAAVTRYTAEFGLKGRFTPQLLEAVGDPFLLRMVAEVYGGGERELPPDVAETAVLQRYLTQKLDKIDDPALRADVRRTIVATADALIAASEKDSVSPPLGREEGTHAEAADPGVYSVPEREVDERLPGIDTRARTEAVRAGLLLESVEIGGRWQVGFQYDRVRDYVIAAHVFQFDRLREAEFRSGLAVWTRNPLIRSALALYLRAPAEAHRACLRDFARAQAARFVDSYERLRSMLGPLARERVDPSCPGPAGVLWELDDRGRSVIALFKAEKASERVLEVHGYGWAVLNREFPEPRVNRFQNPGNWDLVVADPDRRAAEWMLDELRSLARKGGLDDRASDVLATEKILAILNDQRAKLRLPRATGSCEAVRVLALDLLPLEPNEMLRRIHSVFGAAYYTNRYVRGEFERQEAEARSHGRTVSHGGVVIEPEVSDDCARRGREEAERGVRFPAENLVGGNPLRVLEAALEAFASRGMRITEPHLPRPDLPDSPRCERLFELAYSGERLAAFVETFFRLFLREYEVVARNTFGEMAVVLPFLREYPLDAIVRYWRPHRHDWRDTHYGGALHYTFVPSGTRLGGDVDFAFGDQDSALSAVDAIDGSGDIRTRWGPRPRSTSLWFGYFNQLITNGRETPVEWQGSSGGAGNHTPLRSWVHKFVENDLREIDAETLLSLIRSRK